MGLALARARARARAGLGFEVEGDCDVHHASVARNQDAVVPAAPCKVLGNWKIGLGRAVLQGTGGCGSSPGTTPRQQSLTHPP